MDIGKCADISTRYHLPYLASPDFFPVRRREQDMSQHTAAEEVDAITERLDRGEQTWAATSPARRRELLRELQRRVGEQGAAWVHAAARIKQLAPDSQLLGEEWITGPWAVAGYADALASSLERLERGDDLLQGFPTRQAPGGRLAIEVLPHGVYDRLLLNGFRAEVWMPPEVTEAEVHRSVGLAQRQPAVTRGTVLVLGAGNIFSIAPLDTLYQLYAQNRVVVLKLNPITDPLKPVFEAIFEPFLELGVVEILTGGIEVGSALAYHRRIGAVHMTGSEQTHDAIVW